MSGIGEPIDMERRWFESIIGDHVLLVTRVELMDILNIERVI